MGGTTVLLLLFISACSAELHRDVVYLPSTESKITENVPVKKSALGSLPMVPMAWIAGDITPHPLRQISVCMWAKSLDQDSTGTLFAYSTSTEKVEFGLVGINSKNIAKEEQGSNRTHTVYVVIKGKRSRIPIDLRLDDVRWHHVCLTWASRLGIWRVYLDGVKIEQGKNLKRGHTLRPGGRFFVGGGVFKWVEEESTVNGSDVSHQVIRISTGFRPMVQTVTRKKRDLFSTETKRFVGKITDFYVWGTLLTKIHIGQMRNCSTAFRKEFNAVARTESSYAKRFVRGRLHSRSKKKPLSWVAHSLLYAWDVATITMQTPAGLQYSGDICGHPITVECESGYILVSVDKEVTKWYNVEDEAIRLKDPNCTPARRGNYLIFHLANMRSCGTQRSIIDRHVVYTNTISNSPKEAATVYIGRLFKAKIECKFPLDVAASTRQIITGSKPEMLGKTVVTNPLTQKQDLEAVFMLFEDESFTSTLRQDPVLKTQEPVFGGILIKGIHRQEEGEEKEEVNVVVDQCWMETKSERQEIVDHKGCSSNSVRLIENGEKPQVRMELPTRNIKPNTPTYIECAIYPCVGTNCKPNCAEQGTNGTIPEKALSRKVRDLDEEVEDERYFIRVGPLFYEEESEDFEDYKSGGKMDATNFRTAVACVTLIVVMAIGAMCTAYIVVRKTKRTPSSGWDTIEGAGKKSSRPIRVHSFTFCKPSRNVYSIYPPAYHAVTRAKFQASVAGGTHGQFYNTTSTVQEELEDVPGDL